MSTKGKPELRPAAATPKPAVPPTAVPTPAAPSGNVATFPEDPQILERRGPGRPPKLCPTCSKPASECKCSKSAAVPDLSQDTIKKLLAGTFKTVGGAISIISGVEMEKMQKIWTLAEGELMLMGPQATELANKYADDFLKLFATEIAFGVTILPIVAVKAMLTKQLIAAHKAALKEAAPPSPNARDVGTRAAAA